MPGLGPVGQYATPPRLGQGWDGASEAHDVKHDDFPPCLTSH